jgi:outer membrane protein TolC
MKVTSQLLFTAGLATSLILTATADDSVVLPEHMLPQLKQIMANAVTQSPRMILRNLDVMVAEGDLIQAKAGLLPSVSGYYQVSKAKDIREDQSGTLDTDKVAYNLLLSQPVFHWNERRNNARIGELRKRIAEQQYGEAYRMLAQEIRSTYMQLILTKIQVANVRNERLLSDKALKLAEGRLAQKVTSEGEIFQVRIANERAHLAAEYAEMELLRIKQKFCRSDRAAPTGRRDHPRRDQQSALIPGRD